MGNLASARVLAIRVRWETYLQLVRLLQRRLIEETALVSLAPANG